MKVICRFLHNVLSHIGKKKMQFCKKMLNVYLHVCKYIKSILAEIFLLIFKNISDKIWIILNGLSVIQLDMT